MRSYYDKYEKEQEIIYKWNNRPYGKKQLEVQMKLYNNDSKNVFYKILVGE